MGDRYILQMENIEKEYYGNRVLKGISLNLRPGEIMALVGENGAGKSTLMNVLFGMEQIRTTGGFKGRVIFDGEETRITSPREAMEKGIGMVHQEFMLLPGFTITENIKLNREILKPSLLARIFGKRLSGLDHRAMGADARKSLDRIGLELPETMTVDGLPVGFMQFVEIAREIDKTGMKLIVFDEPTAVLTEIEAGKLLDTIRMIARQGVAVIFISHKLDEIFEICDRLTVFKDGEYVGDYDIADLNQFKLISLMVGKDTVTLERNKDAYRFASEQTVAQASGIYQGMRLNGINVDIKRGEVLGLAGLLGSGRSELAQVLFGTRIPDKGDVFWFGEPAHIHKPADAIKKGMGFCTEDRKVEGIIPHLSVKENMTIALLPRLQKFGFVKKKEQDEIVKKYIERLKIKTPNPEQAICNLSGGNQQKVLLARWMCMNPKLMILDEPTRGIDVGAKAEIETLIQELSDNGISVLMISSEIAELERNCDRVVVMREGRAVGEVINEDINQNKIMELIAKGSESEGNTHE